MTNNHRFFETLISPHKTEKVFNALKKNNVVVLKVSKNSNKLEIKKSIENIFNITVIKINTLLIKGKTKKYKKIIGRTKGWKKAYIKIKSGQNLEFFSHDE